MDLTPEALLPVQGLPILVADHNPTNRRVLSDMLSHWGMLPTVVANEAEVLTAIEPARLAATPFAVILLDATMPSMQDLTLASRIQAQPMVATTPLVLLTSACHIWDTSRCHKLGITASLTKPVSQIELQHALLHAVGDIVEPSALPALPSETVPSPNPPPLDILLAEDNAVNQELAVKFLEKQGHTVTVVTNGQEVLSALGQQPFDLILMDVQMPELGGLQTVTIIRGQEQHSGGHIPIIAMTAHAMQGDRERCPAAGMDDYMSKPIQVQTLFKTIDRVVASQSPPERYSPEVKHKDIIFDEDDVLEQLSHDRALLREIIDIFLHDMPPLLDTIHQAIATGDAKSLQHAAHTLKGALGGLGAPAAMQAAFHLEQVGSSGDLANASGACQLLEQELSQLLPILTAFSPQ